MEIYRTASGPTIPLNNLTVIASVQDEAFQDHFVVHLGDADMRQAGLRSGDYVTLRTRRARVSVATVQREASLPPNTVRISTAARLNLR